jgi:hypothetical protein
MNWHNCVYWSCENLNVHIDKALNLPSLSVWCGVSSRGVVVLFFFEVTVIGAAYLKMLQESIVPVVRQLYGYEDVVSTRLGTPTLPS